MKKIIFILTLSLLLVACANKTLQLPQVAVTGPTGIQNHTEIWVFYKFDNQEIQAEINKNNTITSTHWIINIDKRLPMSEVVPVLQMIKAKRAKKTIHSVDNVNDYLSYSDILNKTIALFKINTIQYLTLTHTEVKAIEKEKPCPYIITFSNDFFKINDKKYLPSDWKASLFSVIKDSCVQLQFESSLRFQNYMKYRLELNTFLPKTVTIESTEYLIKEQ